MEITTLLTRRKMKVSTHVRIQKHQPRSMYEYRHIHCMYALTHAVASRALSNMVFLAQVRPLWAVPCKSLVHMA